MTNSLKQYFPLIREREKIMSEIREHEELKKIFYGWIEEQQEEFLDFCTGAKGVKILYDSFFKEILNPETAPERLDQFLSVILKKTVKIVQILPNDSTRIADESALLITDIVVELEDGSLANVEIQKIGFAFPGQRSACYSADLLLRQYKPVRGQKKKNFSYRDIKSVYTMVLFEKSTQEFHELKDVYIHRSSQKFDTGLKLEMLQEFILIPLDIFKENADNDNIGNSLDAWLTFLCMDSPNAIINLIKHYPEFKPMYEDVYKICQNIERVMGMFSKELRELDRNTIQYMIDEMQQTIDRQAAELVQQKELEQRYKEALEQIEELKKN